MQVARVLLVEDEPTIATALVYTLQYVGHSVTHACDGMAGFKYLGEPPFPDVVLVDLFMPVMSGKAFLSRMRAQPHLREIPVILMTGAVMTEDDFPPPGSYQDYIAKPFSVADVLAAIDRLVPAPGK